LKWNRFGTFNKFITAQQTPLDSILPLKQHLKYIVPLNGRSSKVFNDYDFIIIVHYSQFMVDRVNG
jgi:hypothetical protein